MMHGLATPPEQRAGLARNLHAYAEQLVSFLAVAAAGAAARPAGKLAGGEVVAAARCPVDVSAYPRRHVIVVKHAGERQTFSVHEVAHNHVEWVGGQGHYNLGYGAVIRLMAEKAAGRA
jgi:hypothetical protein